MGGFSFFSLSWIFFVDGVGGNSWWSGDYVGLLAFQSFISVSMISRDTNLEWNDL